MQLGKINSSASFIYPIKWMKEVLKFTDDELKDIIKKQTHSNIASSQIIENLIKDNDIVIDAGYGDIRTELNDPTTIKQAYNNLQVIGVADAGANDAIQYSKKWFKNEEKLLKNLRKAFCELVSDPNNEDIFNGIYSHKKYYSPGENATASEITAWETKNDQNYTDIEAKFDDINKLIKAVKTN